MPVWVAAYSAGAVAALGRDSVAALLLLPRWLFHLAGSGAQAAGSAVAAFLVLFPPASLAP